MVLLLHSWHAENRLKLAVLLEREREREKVAREARVGGRELGRENVPGTNGPIA